MDGAGLGEEAIIHGGEWVADRFGTEDGAIRLDGVDDYVEIPSSGQINFGDSESFTVALWWSPDDEVSHDGFATTHPPSAALQTVPSKQAVWSVSQLAQVPLSKRALGL